MTWKTTDLNVLYTLKLSHMNPAIHSIESPSVDNLRPSIEEKTCSRNDVEGDCLMASESPVRSIGSYGLILQLCCAVDVGHAPAFTLLPTYSISTIFCFLIRRCDLSAGFFVALRSAPSHLPKIVNGSALRRVLSC